MIPAGLPESLIPLPVSSRIEPYLSSKGAFNQNHVALIRQQ